MSVSCSVCVCVAGKMGEFCVFCYSRLILSRLIPGIALHPFRNYQSFSSGLESLNMYHICTILQIMLNFLCVSIPRLNFARMCSVFSKLNEWLVRMKCVCVCVFLWLVFCFQYESISRCARIRCQALLSVCVYPRKIVCVCVFSYWLPLFYIFYFVYWFGSHVVFSSFICNILHLFQCTCPHYRKVRKTHVYFNEKIIAVHSFACARAQCELNVCIENTPFAICIALYCR